MTTMTPSLVLEAPAVVAVRDVALPATLAPGEVLLRTLACGICGSDLRYYVGDNPWAQHTLGYPAPVDWERTILGHEVCAVIEAVGPDVSPTRVGETVAVLPSHPCQSCADCAAGRANLCKRVSHLGHGGGWPDDYDRSHFPGAIAERFVYFADSCFAVDLSAARAEEYALTDMVAVGVHAAKRAAQVRAAGTIGSRALVIGCGQVGLSIAQVAGMDASVVGVDTGEAARAIAAAVGIDSRADFPASEENFDAIFDTVCTKETITAALARLASGGVLVLLAPHTMTDFGIAPLAVGGERAVTTSCNFDPPVDFTDAIAHIATRRVDVRPYITRRVSLADAPATFADLHEARGNEFKVIIMP